MIRKLLLKIPFIIFIITLSIFFYLLIIDRNPSKVPSALINNSVPEFETNSLFGDKKFYSSKELKHEITLVNFFATWCKPCRDEHVYIQRFKDEKALLRLSGINNSYFEDIVNYKGKSEWIEIDSDGILYYLADHQDQINTIDVLSRF